ncbi:MAG: trimethylamine methyltransferase family protein [Anaerolineae bacterium]|jgi:trimethylamine--corrinoid protein Co-methyltransferase
MLNLEPIQPKLHLDVLTGEQVSAIQSATLDVLEHVGVCFPSERALAVFAEHGAEVDENSQIVRLPADLVSEAMEHAPRSYVLGGRTEDADLLVDGKTSYLATDGCGVETLDFETRERRSSCKDDVAKMARVSDYLSSISFYWPMVSAQDYGKTAPLHELDASFSNTVKHVQTETVMGRRPAQYAVRMGEAIAGSAEAMRARPPFSVLICTIAPLAQDKEGIEAGMVYAEAGIPVGFMAMPNMGATAPATPGGALVIGNAEVVSAMVLMQLVAPGAPVFHSILASVMDPHTAEYIVGIPQKYLCNAAAVQLAHDWGVPTLAGAFGMDAEEPGSWQQGRDNTYTALLVPLVGADLITGSGLLEASTLLVPEQIILDDEVYHTNRVLLDGLATDGESLALDVIFDVGPKGHFLAQDHTRQHLRDIWIPELTHPRPSPTGQPRENLGQRARAELQRILADHEPDPLPGAVRKELKAILASAAKDLG